MMEWLLTVVFVSAVSGAEATMTATFTLETFAECVDAMSVWTDEKIISAKCERAE